MLPAPTTKAHVAHKDKHHDKDSSNSNRSCNTNFATQASLAVDKPIASGNGCSVEISESGSYHWQGGGKGGLQSNLKDAKREAKRAAREARRARRTGGIPDPNR